MFVCCLSNLCLSSVGEESSGVASTQGLVRQRFFHRAKSKSLRLTFLIVVAFIVCWTPYQAIFIIHTFIDPNIIEADYLSWIFFFGMANSMVNPMIYGASYACERKSNRYRGNR